ncbi:transcriptional regulator [Pseudorhodobacter turbinis]|uniref:Transcriptional regulator n=1 Tax=Pseudorhodobacter turbinis TaxID=2500533 RepID=A0A4P8EGW8_9RHOB|nr:ChrR family anti-sigma-E factor [Pseudorhodobacter turbinis]QCO56107.1 transcriptional regulator [Pseudorhodobacter turbinis]
MTIRHHITDQLLMGYSAGQLPEAFNLVVAVHLSLCDECRARLGAFDAIGGALMGECDSVAMMDSSLTATLDRLTQATPTPRPRKGCKVFPAPLVDYVGGDLASVKWRSIGMGVRQAILPTDAGASARLLYIPAGQKVADHSHRGMELTLVLQGAFRDETDRFGPGDLEIANEELNHQPVAEVGPDCICLAATDAPLRFNGLLPRLAQPFLRI